MHECQNNSFNFTYTVSHGVELGVISGRNTNQQHPSCIELVVKIKGKNSACIRLGIVWLEESSHTDTVTELTSIIIFASNGYLFYCDTHSVTGTIYGVPYKEECTS